MAQALHALAEFAIKHPKRFKAWHDKSNYICALSVKNEAELESLIKKLHKKNIIHASFYEPDLGNQLTAVAIEPGTNSKKVCSSYPLALKKFAFSRME